MWGGKEDRKGKGKEREGKEREEKERKGKKRKEKEKINNSITLSSQNLPQRTIAIIYTTSTKNCTLDGLG